MDFSDQGHGGSTARPSNWLLCGERRGHFRGHLEVKVGNQSHFRRLRLGLKLDSLDCMSSNRLSWFPHANRIIIFANTCCVFIWTEEILYGGKNNLTKRTCLVNNVIVELFPLEPWMNFCGGMFEKFQAVDSNCFHWIGYLFWKWGKKKKKKDLKCCVMYRQEWTNDLLLLIFPSPLATSRRQSENVNTM